MNKTLSQLIDFYALFQLHREKSKVSQFNRGLCENEDFASFYIEPKMPDICLKEKEQQKGYTIGEYSFESDVQSIDSCNKFSSGLYYRSDKGKSPLNIVFVNGWRASDHERLQKIYLERFMNLNYNMYFSTLPYHLERNTETAIYSGEYMISANVDRTVQAIRQAVSDVRALIRWIKEKDGGPVVLVGLSLGGLVANLTAASEYRLDALVSIFYANDLAYTIWETIPGKHIKADFVNNEFTYEELRKSWRIINPSNFIPAIEKENILLLTAKYDKYVHKNDGDKLWEAWDKPERVLMDCGHSGIALSSKTIFTNTISFIRRYESKDGQRL